MPQPPEKRRPPPSSPPSPPQSSPPSPPQSSPAARNRASNRRNWSKAEAYLTNVEKAHGLAKAWELRERLERGEVTVDDLPRW